MEGEDIGNDGANNNGQIFSDEGEPNNGEVDEGEFEDPEEISISDKFALTDKQKKMSKEGLTRLQRQLIDLEINPDLFIMEMDYVYHRLGYSTKQITDFIKENLFQAPLVRQNILDNLDTFTKGILNVSESRRDNDFSETLTTKDPEDIEINNIPTGTYDPEVLFSFGARLNQSSEGTFVADNINLVHSIPNIFPDHNKELDLRGKQGNPKTTTTQSFLTYEMVTEWLSQVEDKKIIVYGLTEKAPNKEYDVTERKRTMLEDALRVLISRNETEFRNMAKINISQPDRWSLKNLRLWSDELFKWRQIRWKSLLVTKTYQWIIDQIRLFETRLSNIGFNLDYADDVTKVIAHNTMTYFTNYFKDDVLHWVIRTANEDILPKIDFSAIAITSEEIQELFSEYMRIMYRWFTTEIPETLLQRALMLRKIINLTVTPASRVELYHTWLKGKALDPTLENDRSVLMEFENRVLPWITAESMKFAENQKDLIKFSVDSAITNPFYNYLLIKLNERISDISKSNTTEEIFEKFFQSVSACVIVTDIEKEDQAPFKDLYEANNDKALMYFIRLVIAGENSKFANMFPIPTFSPDKSYVIDKIYDHIRGVYPNNNPPANTKKVIEVVIEIINTFYYPHFGGKAPVSEYIEEGNGIFERYLLRRFGDYETKISESIEEVVKENNYEITKLTERINSMSKTIDVPMKKQIEGDRQIELTVTVPYVHHTARKITFEWNSNVYHKTPIQINNFTFIDFTATKHQTGVFATEDIFVTEGNTKGPYKSTVKVNKPGKYWCEVFVCKKETDNKRNHIQEGISEVSTLFKIERCKRCHKDFDPNESVFGECKWIVNPAQYATALEFTEVDSEYIENSRKRRIEQLYKNELSAVDSFGTIDFTYVGMHSSKSIFPDALELSLDLDKHSQNKALYFGLVNGKSPIYDIVSLPEPRSLLISKYERLTEIRNECIKLLKSVRNYGLVIPKVSTLVAEYNCLMFFGKKDLKTIEGIRPGMFTRVHLG